ncbi:MAG: aminoglycoside phosphotransferase [Deltaproteobacteria bacterium]|nr:aminoglycoside phosphotransferase [Deltaproteobacteria bacterium]
MAVLTQTEVFPWVESTLGGKIIAFTRQAGRESGGRPGWFITVERTGGTQRYYVRGERGEDFGYTRLYGLQREGRLLQLLHAEGIPVPEIIASCERPNVLIMEYVDGLSDFTLIERPEERDRIARHFAEIMARWHAIPAEKFVNIGFLVPQTREDYVIKDLEVWEQGHFPLLKEPVPLVTFACGWLRRNIPDPPARPVLVQGDTGPGQFIFKDGRVQTVTDWELANLGDPMRELAHVRTRDMWYPTGNLLKWFQYYSEFSGVPLDTHKLRYYNVIGMLTTALALGPAVQQMDPRDEHAEWIAQDIWSKRATAEALAEAMGLELPPITLPTADAPYVSQWLDVLEDNLRNELLPHIPDNFLQHRLRLNLRLLAHIRNVAEIGHEIDALELADMAQLLGHRPPNVRAGHRAMEALVRKAGPDMDEALTRYFHRHALRQEALMRGGMGRAENIRATPID